MTRCGTSGAYPLTLRRKAGFRLHPDVEKNRLWVFVLRGVDVHGVILPYDAVGVMDVPEDVNLLVRGDEGVWFLSLMG